MEMAMRAMKKAESNLAVITAIVGSKDK